MLSIVDPSQLVVSESGSVREFDANQNGTTTLQPGEVGVLFKFIKDSPNFKMVFSKKKRVFDMRLEQYKVLGEIGLLTLEY